MNFIPLCLLTTITLISIIFIFGFIRSLKQQSDPVRPSIHFLLIGVVSNFFDTLGIGSFPTSTSYLRIRRMISDEKIPGTLNIGHAPAAVAEALIFITVVPVDPMLLLASTLSTALGATVGSKIVIGLPRKPLQWILGISSLIAACLLIAVNLHWMPGGGTAYELTQWRFVAAVLTVFILGALMAAGVGFFGPCLIVLSLLGMHPLAIFPIMMSAGAIQQLISGLRYLRAQHYQADLSVGLAVGGIVGVLIAAYVVKSLQVGMLRWLVAIVALYVALDFIRATRQQTPQPNASSMTL
jgi:uncharacterized membrane protein YfcA